MVARTAPASDASAPGRVRTWSSPLRAGRSRYEKYSRRRRRFAKGVRERGRDDAADGVGAIALIETAADDGAVMDVAVDERLVDHDLRRRGRTVVERRQAVAVIQRMPITAK